MTDTQILLDEPALDVEEEAKVAATALAAAEAAERETRETEELLASAGLDHVPTIEEAKALLDARRAEIRKAVMVEADKRDWCEDGTRKVCANLRLERPGNRTERLIEMEMTLKVSVKVMAYTEEGAIQRMVSRGLLNPAWIKGHLYVNTAEVTPTAASIDGGVIDLSQFIEEKPEVTA